MTAVAASDDPMIQFVLRTDPLSRAARQVWEEEVVGPIQDAGERIARVRYTFEGPGLYPDATFSLRLSYGKVAGWTDQGQQTAAFTTFAGLLRPRHRRAALPAAGPLDRRRPASSTRPPCSTSPPPTTSPAAAPARRWSTPRARSSARRSTGNIHCIAGDFTYDGALNRTIAVSTVAISEALQKVYGDTALARELSQQ